MRFSTILAIVAALTISTPAVPTIVDRSVFAGETGDWCHTFCIHSDECCEQICVSSLRPVLNRITHRCDSLCGCAGSSVYDVASVWSTGSRVEPRSDVRPLEVGFEEFWWRRRRSLGDQLAVEYYLLSFGISYNLVLISS
ncbi:hypothetical protein EDD22DRAFT_407796 [Suillus occidentalis]|nr:hypothetical protein EDD22DRAFT_407796 [Suillus occidentalis]